MPEDGTADMKISVLSQAMCVYRNAKIVGDYSFDKTMLYTEKLIGNVFACVGFVRNNEYYIPNTLLKEDVRDITHRPQKRVLAIFRKKTIESTYSELCYVRRDISVSDITMPESVVHRIIVPANLAPNGKSPNASK